jgi:UDP-2,3-diacylglucosamine pyrophosphatase LpxH
MEHKIYIIGDVELGRKDIMDGFTDDPSLVNFIKSIQSKKPDQNISLVFNGDSFDFLKMAYKGDYPRVITKEISLWKINEIYINHKKIFTALKKFAANPLHKLIFVIGNHDPDLVWPEVQKFIKKILSDPKAAKSPARNIEFTFRYSFNGLQAEHGHLLDPFFVFNINKPIIKYKKKQILNLPWGCRICFSHLVKIKQKFPEEEKIQPVTKNRNNPEFKKYLNKTIASIILKKLILHPIIYFFDPTHSAPVFKIVKDTLRRRFKALAFDQFSKIDFKKIIKKSPQAKIVVLGHTHSLADMKYKKTRFLITDTWRDEINVENMEVKPKTYAEIIFKNEKISKAGLKIFRDK